MTATETSAVAWGGTELPYTIRRAESYGPLLSPREFISGESVLYLGRHYRLKVCRPGNQVTQTTRSIRSPLNPAVGMVDIRCESHPWSLGS